MSLLSVEDLVVRFGGITAVDQASFTVEEGSVTGLIGPNGAGKSTCFDAITGLRRPTSGRVRFDGRDVTGMRVSRRSRMGMARTFQRLEAFGSLTVRDNVRVALDIRDGRRELFRNPGRRVDQLLERVGIATYADDRADSVPTGVARLLELARALACNPRLLLLDEPSAGLDDQETDEFGGLVRQLAGHGCTVLMVEHDMDLVMAVCDPVLVLDFGAVIAEGSPAQVRADPRVQQAYLGRSGGDEESAGPLDPVTRVLPAVRP
ncbi:MAG: ABC transporter ATP-binding protein [Marmoricola sp.]